MMNQFMASPLSPSIFKPNSRMGVTYGDRMELELPLEMKSIALGTCFLDVHAIWIKALLQIT
jgi:hypothetical protein